MKSRFWRMALPPLISGVLLTLAAQALHKLLHVRSYLLPAPSEVLSAAAANAGELAAATWRTGVEAMLGLALSIGLGLLIAVGLSMGRWVQRAFYPYAIFFQTVPIIAIAPLLVIQFGYGLGAIVASAFIVSVFPVIANTLAGLRSVDPALEDLFRLYGAGRWATLWKLKLPWAMPNIFTGLRIAAGLAVIGTIVGEFVAANLQGGGIGITVMVALKEQKLDKVFAAVGLGSLVGLVFFAAVNLASWLSLRHWHASERQSP